GMILILPGSATSLVSSNNGNYQAFAENSKGIPYGTITKDDQFGSLIRSGDFDHDGSRDLQVSTAGKTIDGGTHARAGYFLREPATGLTATGTKIISQATPGIEGDPQANAFFGGR